MHQAPTPSHKQRAPLAMAIGSAVLSMSMLAPAQAWQKDVITIWIKDDKGHKGLQAVGDEFTRQTGVKVKVEHFEDAATRFDEAMKAGNGSGPDIWIWPHDRIGDWVKRGWLVPIVPDAAFRQDVVQVAWDGFTLGGKVWGYPMAVEAIALLYNKDLVPEPPKTFEELIPLHNKLKAKGVRAIGWETASPYFTWPLLAAGGGYVFQRKLDGTYDARDSGINHPAAIAGAEFLVKMMAAGAIPEGGMSYAVAEEDMKAGKQAMWITGPWAWESLTKSRINFGVAVLPTFNGKSARPFVGVLGAMLTQGSPNKDVSVRFLEQYLLKPAGLTAMNKDKPLGVPAAKSMFWTLYSDTRIRTSMDAIYGGRPMPSNSEMTLFWTHLGTALNEVMGKQRTPKDALDLAASNIRGGGVKPVVATRK